MQNEADVLMTTLQRCRINLRTLNIERYTREGTMLTLTLLAFNFMCAILCSEKIHLIKMDSNI